MKLGKMNQPVYISDLGDGGGRIGLLLIMRIEKGRIKVRVMDV